MGDGRVPSGQEKLRRSRLSELARGPSSLTLATSITAQALTVISGVIAARALGVEGRGTLAILWLIPVILVMLGGIGIPQATTFYVARELRNARGVVRISVGITLGLFLLLAALYSIGLLVFGRQSDAFTLGDGFLSVGLIPMFLAQNLGVAVLLGMKRYRAFNAGRIVPVLVYAAALLGLFAVGHASLSWILAVTLFSWGAAAVNTWSMVLRNLPSGPGPVTATTATAGDIAKFGLKGVIGSVSPIDDVRIDQFVVGLLLDTRALGLYVAAIAFCNLPRFVAQSIGSVSFPRIASAGNVDDAWALTGRSIRLGLIAVGATVVGLYLTLPTLIPLMFGEDFTEAVAIGRILIIAAFFLSVHRLLTELARGLGHPGYGSITELINLAAFAVAVAVFATPASTDGIATAVLVGGVASSSVLAILLHRLRAAQRTPESSEEIR